MQPLNYSNMKPENYLNERGREIFYRLVEAIHNQDLRDIDSFGLSVFAQMLCRYEHVVKEVNNGNDVTEAKTGWMQVSPYQKEMTDLQVKIPVYLKKYGLTPEDRANLTKSENKHSKLKAL